MDNSRFFDPYTLQRGVRRNFSTPLTPKRGVHALYELSDKKRWFVHTQCNHRFYPSYANVVVDGWDSPVIDLTPEDITHLDNRGLLSTARILCPECRQVVPHSRLAPEYREWVAENPSNKSRSGYWLGPFDIPFDPQGRPKRTPEWVMRSRVDFGSSLSKFYNHRLGLPYADATCSFLDQAVAENAVLAPLSPGQAALSAPQDLVGLVAGIDTGKPSWGVVARPLPDGRVDVLWLFTLPIQGPNAEDLPQLIFDLLKPYRITQVVIDGQPFTDSVMNLQSKSLGHFPIYDADHPHPVLACDYRLKDTALNPIQVKPNGLEVTTHRTRVISQLASDVNSGRWRFPRPELLNLVGHDTTKPGTLRNHLSNITKINTDPEQDGHGQFSEQGAVWVGTQDHYCHALVYASIAAHLVRQRLFLRPRVPLPNPRACTPGSTLINPLNTTAPTRIDPGRQGVVYVDHLGTEGAIQSVSEFFRHI